MNTRHQRILEQLRLQREVSVQDLAQQLQVSPITIRRDLEQLERDGALTRTHGGAVLSQFSVVEFAFQDRAQEHLAEKQAIAKHLARVIAPGMTIVLDTGTTTLEVARAIAGVPRLRVLTSSLAIASALHTYDNIDLVLLGGTMRHTTPDLSGPLTEENIRKFRTELAILGADAVDRDGLYTSDLDIARISRSMIDCARESWLVVDSSKFTSRSFVKYAEWSMISHLVTDERVGAEDRAWAEDGPCELHVVAVK